MLERRPNQFAQSLFIETATCAARRATFMGRSFRVVPAVLVRAQVLRNNLGASYLPAEEITDDWAAQWNGVPVLVGPHPSIQGHASSGRTPELWNDRGVGWIFNAKAETVDGTRRLAGEVWLDEARATVVPGFPAVLARLDANQPVELSTGFATTPEMVTGVHNGDQYELVMHPVGADHLVISADMTGACSISHGCGLGANEEGKVEDTKNGQTKLKQLLGKVAELFGKTPAALSWEDQEAMRVNREIAALALNPSDDERRQMLKEALQEAYGSTDHEVIVCDVYTDPEKYVMFWFMTPMGPMPKGQEFYQVSWVDADNDGVPEVKGEPMLVRKMTSYAPVGPGPAGDGAPAANKEETPAAVVPAVEDPELVQAVTNLKAATEKLAALV